MTASDDVFATFELLEAILLSVPHHDLLISVGVSRTWHQTILSSTPLQQRLFLAPAPADTPWMQNPILAAKFWPIFHVININNTDDLAEKLRAECWGPCVYGHTPLIRYLIAGPPCWVPHCQNPRCQSAIEGFSAADQEAYFRPEASWRKMLAMQPPVKLLRILQYGFSHEDPREEDEKKLGSRKVMQMSHERMSRGAFPQAVLARRAKGVIQWDMWDVVGTTDEDEGSQGNKSIYVIEGEEGMDRHTLVYVDWWMDRNAPAMNNGREEEVVELRRMAGIEIVPGQ